MMNEEKKEKIETRKQRIIKDIIGLTGAAIGILVMCEHIENSIIMKEGNNNEDIK